MVSGVEDPKTRATSGVRSIEDMDRAIKELTSKFTSMSIALMNYGLRSYVMAITQIARVTIMVCVDFVLTTMDSLIILIVTNPPIKSGDLLIPTIEEGGYGVFAGRPR